MSLLSNAVKIANSVTLGLGMQAQGSQKVTLMTLSTDAGIGAPVYTPSAGKKYNAVVEKKQRQVRSFSGDLVMSSTTVLFLDPKIVVAAGDQIILADKSGGLVLGTSGPVDASGQLITEAYLG